MQESPVNEKSSRRQPKQVNKQDNSRSWQERSQAEDRSWEPAESWKTREREGTTGTRTNDFRGSNKKQGKQYTGKKGYQNGQKKDKRREEMNMNKYVISLHSSSSHTDTMHFVIAGRKETFVLRKTAIRPLRPL